MFHCWVVEELLLLSCWTARHCPVRRPPGWERSRRFHLFLKTRVHEISRWEKATAGTSTLSALLKLVFVCLYSGSQLEQCRNDVWSVLLSVQSSEPDRRGGLRSCGELPPRTVLCASGTLAGAMAQAGRGSGCSARFRPGPDLCCMQRPSPARPSAARARPSIEFSK